MNTIKDRLITLFFYLSILFFIIGFQFSDTPLSGWYQQFMPNLNGRPVSDVTFIDSLIGFAVTPYTANDTAYIIKTVNGGDNWNIIYRQPTNVVGGFNRVILLNRDTAFVGGNFIFKTTNGGLSWFQVNTPFGVLAEDMDVHSNDTIWIVDHESSVGGVYRTINGGASWIRQYNGGLANPVRIYMHPNAMLGFYSDQGNGLWRTLDGGFNWSPIGTNEGFRSMYFADSLTGWKCGVSSGSGMKKTSNKGLNWVEQITPQGGIIQSSFIYRFSNVGRDTIWGTGGYVMYPNNEVRGILYRTVNGGINWLFQVPDTAIHISSPAYIDFVNRLNGWGYLTMPTGIHTTTGGNDTFYTVVIHTSSTTSEEFKLNQNYPNPFNPQTNIKYQIVNNSYVNLSVFDITGKVIEKLVDVKQNRGTYSVDFTAKNISSGVYFYRIQITSEKGGVIYAETKKMILIK